MKKCIIFLLSLTIFVSMPLRSYCADSENITSKSSILMCMDTGDIIKEDNAYEHLSPASVTKIMSILLFLEAIDNKQIALDDMVTASENAVSKGGSQIWLEVGEQMSVNDLLKAVIISSANDACTLLSEYVGGSADEFVNLMNNRVRELGLRNTNFENCTGLDDNTTNHYSCAYDLAVIATEVMKHSLITQYSLTWLDSLRDGKTELNNTNKLINQYDGITGLKTGTTSNSGFCLCATATRDNLNLVSVVLGSSTSEDRFDLSRQLLDYGFANYQIKKLEIDQNKLIPVRVKNGVIKSIIPDAGDNECFLVKKNSGEFSYEYSIDDKVDAPVKAGDIVGKIIVKNENTVLAEIPIKAKINVEKVSFKYILINVLQNI